MDPISAAGIGLSLTSLILQVFGGCIKGYQILADAEDMPATYQHLRVRLQIEQARLLNWGEKAGLVEELLEHPSRILQLNRNLIVDILLEIQALIKSCVKIQTKYDDLVPVKPIPSSSTEETSSRRFPKGTNTFLVKTLAFIEKTPQVPRRLQWAMIRSDSFGSLVEKLIGYNDSIEAILDSRAIENLHAMQHQTLMVILQLNSKVDELTQISSALRIETRSSTSSHTLTNISNTSAVEGESDNMRFARLAAFKAHQTKLESSPSNANIKPLEKSEIKFRSSGVTRPEAIYNGKPVWIEWKPYTLDNDHHSVWNKTIEERVKKLVILLASDDKPEQFKAPRCLGYFDDKADGSYRYGFIFEKPPSSISSSTHPVSLLDLIKKRKKPSLTKRMALAHTIARCLMYLHSVNWLHKGFRSDNILFFTASGKDPNYTSPILSGFDYARPDLSEELTEAPPERSEHDLYRHPSIVSRSHTRSRKSHDIYSLGLVLFEIAYWQPIDVFINLPKDAKAAKAVMKIIRDLLLTDGCLEVIEAIAGDTYREVVRKCLAGGSELGIVEGADETNADTGAELQRVFSRDIVDRLGGLNI